MTAEPRADWLTEKAALASDVARPTACPRCGAATYTARVGRVAALDVRVDTTPIDTLQEIHARLRGDLTWCLAISAIGPPRLRWRDQWHIAAGRCTHTVHTDHHCRPATPTTLF